MTNSRGRARIGVLVPFTNTNLEPDMALLRPDGASLHFARLGGYDQDEIPDADQMHGLGAADLDEPLRLLQGVRPDVILYGCTSATLTHGPRFDSDLADRISRESGAATVTAAGALTHGLKALNVSQIGFASPYVPAINDMAIKFLAETGITIVARSEVTDTQALVLSCTDMRSVEIIARLEAAVGKPVITSNQAMMFQARQLIGIGDAAPGFGRLLEME